MHNAGWRYVSTDTNQEFQSDGTTWHAIVNGSGVSSLTAPPVLSNWAWVNQGGATAADSSVIYIGASQVTGITFTAPAAGSDNVRLLKKAAPSTPYTITLAYVASIVGANYFSTGFIWRESGSGELVIAGLKYDGGFKFDSYKFNSPTSPAASYVAAAVNWHGLVWLRFTDDGTDRKTYYSGDGVNWLLLHTIGRTDFLTANEVGFGIHVNNGTYTAAMSLVHWVQS